MGAGPDLEPALDAAGYVVRSAPAPDTLATLTPELEGVSVVVWRAGPDRLEGFLDYIVDTPVRGFVYQDEEGAALVLAAGARHRMPVAVAAPDGLVSAVARVLG